MVADDDLDLTGASRLEHPRGIAARKYNGGQHQHAASTSSRVTTGDGNCEPLREPAASPAVRSTRYGPAHRACPGAANADSQGARCRSQPGSLSPWQIVYDRRSRLPPQAGSPNDPAQQRDRRRSYPRGAVRQPSGTRRPKRSDPAWAAADQQRHPSRVAALSIRRRCSLSHTTVTPRVSAGTGLARDRSAYR